VKAPATQPLVQVEKGGKCPKTWLSGAKYFVFLTGFFALVALTGCSSFNRDWKKAAAQPASGSIEGRWEGEWVSEENGHSGNLRCLITRDGESGVKARFRATYAKVLRFSYTVPMSLGPHFDGWEVNGEANLGKLAGGTYYYEGRISPTNFFSTYRNKYDHGIFQLHRPQ
jgi:hypothetical protein